MLELAFYQWFLRELLARLSGADGESVNATTVLTTTPTAHIHSVGGEVIVTPGQSILNARPRQASEVTRVGGRAFTLGDGKRLAPHLFSSPPPVVNGGLGGWLPPPPVMPPQAEASSVAWDAPQHAAHAYLMAEDGLWDSGYPRVTDTSSWCPPLPTDATPVEPSGVLARAGLRRCLADNKARPEHLTSDRFNARLPVMAGVDASGPYYRVVRIPMKTFEYREEVSES